MRHVVTCPRCLGEGRRTLPPYDPLHPEVPFHWREAQPCKLCRGSGVVDADPAAVAAHATAARLDYPLL